jgi:small-conductance mechanosensitive channel
LEKIAEKYRAKTIDSLIKAVTSPLTIFIIISGIYAALLFLEIIEDFWLTGAYFILAAILIARTTSNVFKTLMPVWFKGAKVPRIINRVISLVVYFIALLVILDYFGIAISPLLAALGVGGLAVGLALQSTLANFFAGLYLISDKSIKVGDSVQLENGVWGTVGNVGWRTTKIYTWQNETVIVPNSKLADTQVTNRNSRGGGYAFSIACGVDYSSDLEKVEKVVLDVTKKIIKKTEGASKDYPPAVRFNEFADSNINFGIILSAQSYGEHFKLKHELIKALKKRFDKEKIEISAPTIKVVK